MMSVLRAWGRLFPLISCLALASDLVWRPVRAPGSHAFYFWKTTWDPSRAVLDRLVRHRIGELYVRFFDVARAPSSGEAVPVAPIRFRASFPPAMRVVPVIFIKNAVFETRNGRFARELAGRVWRMTAAMAAEARVQVDEIQIDCDWSERTRTSYFEFLEALRTRVGTVSATIRLHQIKYAARTGVPPIDRGMLMFYNVGTIGADTDRSSIFNALDAGKYAAWIGSYPRPLGLALPAFSWFVHAREHAVVGLVEGVDGTDFETSDAFERMGTDSHRATRSLFLHGRYFAVGDVVRRERTTPAVTHVAARMARAGAGSSHQFSTVALFDLDETTFREFDHEALDSIFALF